MIFCLLSALWQFFIYASAMLCFKVAKSAGLNIGIAQCIWALNPFLVAVIERVFWGVGLAHTQVLGMCSLVACTICVSLSELFQGDESKLEVRLVEGRTPIYVAVLVSLVFPIVCAVFSCLIKYADKKLRLDAFDWNCSSMGMMSLAFQIVGIINFSSGAVEFNLGHFVRGSFGSLGNLSGTVWIIAAFNSDGAPFGPILALVNMQAILVMIVDAIRSQTIPYSLQFVGLALGIFGALLLTIPDHVLALFRCIFCCQRDKQKADSERAHQEEN